MGKRIGGLLLLLVLAAASPAFAHGGGRGWQSGARGFSPHGHRQFRADRFGHDRFHHHFHGERFRDRVFLGFGPGFGGWYGYDPFWSYYGYPDPWYGYGPYALRPYAWYDDGFVDGSPYDWSEPDLYVQRTPSTASSSARPGFWYYCPSARDYYPKVGACAEPWIAVPPRRP